MLRKFLFGMMALSAISVLASEAEAVPLTATLTPFTGDPASIQVTVDQEGNGLKFTVAYQPAGGNTLGDLRGFFFHVADESLINDLTFTAISPAGEITTVCRGANSITSCGSASNNLNGGGAENPGAFDIGLDIGSNGIGSDDIQTLIFTVSATDPLDLATFFPAGLDDNLFGARVTSVGSQDGRGGSSKLKGGLDDTPPPTEVAEPGTLLVLGAGLLGLGLARRRKAN